MQFDFGNNWLEFSKKALTSEKVSAARNDFAGLIGEIDLEGKSFLDIGFGQGLSLLAASEKGANTVGNDINPKCAEVLNLNASYFPNIKIPRISIVIGSILDLSIVEELRVKSKEEKGYDIVHSWGVLHHTGKMWEAIRNASSLVKEGGHLIIAIYNKHWTSPAWKMIKWFYCKSPLPMQKFMLHLFYPIICLAKFIVSGEGPKKQSRGMDFYYDLIDWIGGYPYEYATINEINHFVSKLGFCKIREIAAKMPTGCNEFVFARKAT